MKTNFDISIPSIPTRTIKFKIQDIKNTAFGSQRNRFHQNKTFLTKKFIESFANFAQKPPKSPQQQQTQAGSRVSTSQVPLQQQYRYLIPEQRKYMLHDYDKYKNYQPPILKETKYNRGYSFYKTGIVLPPTKDSKDRSLSLQTNSVSDNFYFPNKREHQNKERKVHLLPTANFKNQTRKRMYQREQAKINKLGPADYFKQPPQKEAQREAPREELTEEIDYKHLRQIITNIVLNSQQGAVVVEEIRDKQKGKDKQRPNYMFVEDDRDRFGLQKYPIVRPADVPGPGAYEVKHSIEEKAQKVIVVEEQRKLLKEWFND